MARHLTNLNTHAQTALKPSIQKDLTPNERAELYKRFLKIEEHRIYLRHKQGAGGLEIANARSLMIDAVIQSLFESALIQQKHKLDNISLVALGGYGRATLNPKSDIDLLFLTPRTTSKVNQTLNDLVQSVLYLLWDMGFKVGHVTRSIKECLVESQKDQQNKTALMDARLIVGDEKLFNQFQTKFKQSCIEKNADDFFDLRRGDLRRRHEKSWHTVFLQEPNVKESCGGMRDYQNICWIAQVKIETKDLKVLYQKKFLSKSAYKELQEAYDFLHRVRNELHYYTKTSNDILTLRLQGIVATAFEYPQADILRRVEAFMKDYYKYTRDIYQHTSSLMEMFEIEQQTQSSGVHSFLTFRKKNRETFDGFYSKDGRIYAENSHIFTQEPHRLMRLFHHCQVRNLTLSPPIRKLVKAHWGLVDRLFRYAKANRMTFQAILERKGEVAKTLRQMHRVGFLGRYLPEFGALDCLVQHEFFHRYTADEHTLRCIEQLDLLIENTSPEREKYRQFFHQMKEPYALYIALILHDTGRAENAREHTDGSLTMADAVCRRLQISGSTRSIIMYLVDNHLTFWRTATTRNLDDPKVIEEFANIVKTEEWLNTLFLFTYVDSNGTSPDAWNSWKESLMSQLHRSTLQFLRGGGSEHYQEHLTQERIAQLKEILSLMREDYEPYISSHFKEMPASAFHYRSPKAIIAQIRTVRHFLQKEEDYAPENKLHAYCIKWLHYEEKGYSEMIIATRDQPLLLEKICCSFASQSINILSADFYTREDNIVVNIFRVCTTNFEPLQDSGSQKLFLKTFEDLFKQERYEAKNYLVKKENYLKPQANTPNVPIPVRVLIHNNQHEAFTVVELQAIDRIGLLHDLFHSINKLGLTTVHARICTEKGMAIDTLYITDLEHAQIISKETLQTLQDQLQKLIKINS